MLERVWSKGKSPTLLMGIQIGSATMRILWRFLKIKLKIELPENHNLKRYVYPNDCCSSIYNSKDAEASEMAGESSKEDMVYIHICMYTQRNITQP